MEKFGLYLFVYEKFYFMKGSFLKNHIGVNQMYILLSLNFSIFKIGGEIAKEELSGQFNER